MCLALDIASAKGFNSAAYAKRSAISYDSERVLEDGTTEQMVGCTGCGAMCTLVSTAHEALGPGTKNDPNQLVSVAEAPQPNPWMELGNFSDCRHGQITVPEAAQALTTPHGLSHEQRQMAKILAGLFD